MPMSIPSWACGICAATTVVALIPVYVFAGAQLDAPASRSSSPQIRLDIAFEGTPALPPRVQARAIEEAAHIWARYGVTIGRADPSAAPDGRLRLAVVTADELAASSVGWGGTFGAIVFTDGVPEPRILVFHETIARVIGDAPLHGRPDLTWPLPYGQLTAGRVIGRVLAHEIGHFLLRSRDHASTGLMQKNQRVPDLVAAGSEFFTLSPDDRRRWHVIAQEMIHAAPSHSYSTSAPPSCGTPDSDPRPPRMSSPSDRPVPCRSIRR